MKEMDEIQDELLGRFVNGELSDEDIEKLNEWKTQSEENDLFLKEIEQIAGDCKRLDVMEQINSNGALAAVKRRIDSEFKWKRILNVWQRVAAVLIIPLILFSVYQNLLPSQESEVVWNEVRTPYGLISKIMLPDSTVVELNGRSKLKYPLVFSGDERVVELDGEAFFKVKTNKKMPFIVKCNTIEIQAVGTSFNVLKMESGEVATSLLEGKVNLLKETSGGRHKLISMFPGQTVKYNCIENKITQQENSGIDRYVAWREGKLIFRSEPLPNVLEQLGRRYNVDFEIEGKLDGKHVYTGTFVNKSLDKVLEFIELTTPVTFESSPEKSDEKRVIKVWNRARK